MKKQTIIVGITGGIAAFKSAQLVSNLMKKGFEVHVLMSENATHFIGAATFEALTKQSVVIDTFERIHYADIAHISLAKKADLFIIIPATANIIAKIANGIADDMLTTTFLAANCPKIVCPAMNTNMFHNPITQDNLSKLQQYQISIVSPVSGNLACGEIGDGKLADLEDIEDAIEMHLVSKKILCGKRVLITAGPTKEAIDPVRYISNHSSGKMGYSLAWSAKALGADVVLVHGPCHIKTPYQVNSIEVDSAECMKNVVEQHYQDADIIIKAAAVSDFSIKQYSQDKLKKDQIEPTIQLKKNPDILEWLGEHKLKNQLLIGFAMETNQLIEYAQDKRKRKNCDAIIANHLLQEGAGFQVDTNVVTFISDSKMIPFEKMSKLELSFKLWEEILNLLESKEKLYVSSN